MSHTHTPSLRRGYDGDMGRNVYGWGGGDSGQEKNDIIKDSLCDAAILVQGQLLTNRDSVISIMERQYCSTAKTLDETLQLQQFTYRQMKKEKRRKVIWKLVAFTAGTLLLTRH